MSQRAVAYIRSVDDPSRENGVAPDPSSPVAQRAAIAAWADRERVEIASWHADEGVGPDTPIAERRGLVAAYREIRAVAAGVLVAANAERFGKDELVCWLIERAALAEGARVATADGSTLPKPAREDDVGYTRGAVDLARAYRRVVVGERVRASLAEKRARGERIGTVPYGFRLAADGLHTERDERESEVIAIVHRLSSVEGLSQRAIVARLAAHGVVGRTGAPLRQTQVAKILRAAR